MGEILMKIVEYISLFLWVVYFGLATYREIRRIRNTSFKELWQKPFHFFRLDSLFFLIVYLLYNYIARDEVLPYLYLVIIIANIVYLLYDLVDNYHFQKIAKEEYYYFVLVGIIIVLTFIYLNICGNVLRIATLTLLLNFLLPSILSIGKKMKKN